jgi:LPXTG-motif cell wall-anchored protein
MQRRFYAIIYKQKNLLLSGMPLETWVFITIFVLAGSLVIAFGLNQAELSLAFTIAGLATISFGFLIFVKKIKKWVERL